MTDQVPADVEKWVGQYLDLRALRRVREQEWKKQDDQIRTLQDKVESKILAFLSAHKLKNIKTSLGTAHTTTRRTASLQDASLFMQFVIDHQAFDLLDRRANATACADYVTEHGVLPPGVNLSTLTSLGVRKDPGTKPVTGTVTDEPQEP